MARESRRGRKIAGFAKAAEFGGNKDEKSVFWRAEKKRKILVGWCGISLWEEKIWLQICIYGGGRIVVFLFFLSGVGWVGNTSPGVESSGSALQAAEPL